MIKTVSYEEALDIAAAGNGRILQFRKEDGERVVDVEVEDTVAPAMPEVVEDTTEAREEEGQEGAE